MTLALVVLVFYAVIAVTLLAGEICHISDIERDPVDLAVIKPPNVSFREWRRRARQSPGS